MLYAKKIKLKLIPLIALYAINNPNKTGNNVYAVTYYGDGSNLTGISGGGWIGTATSDLDMSSYAIKNVGNIQASAYNDDTNSYTLMEMYNGGAFFPSGITDTGGSRGSYGYVPVADGYGGYYWNAQSGGGGSWVGSATSDLNMNGYSIYSVGNICASNYSNYSNGYTLMNDSGSGAGFPNGIGNISGYTPITGGFYDAYYNWHQIQNGLIVS